MAIGQLPQSQAAAGFFLDLRGRWVHLLRACFKALSGPPHSVQDSRTKPTPKAPLPGPPTAPAVGKPVITEKKLEETGLAVEAGAFIKQNNSKNSADLR
jgi:hypothetical protein